MSRDTLNYTHGDTGTTPSSSLNFEQNERPQAGHFDWFWYNVADALSGHAAEFTRLDSDDDGVVDAADGAATWSNGGTTEITHPTDIDFTGDVSISDDGDGTATISVTTYSDDEARAAVDGANVDIAGDADTVDGSHAADFASAGHTHDGRYITESGDTMTGALGLGGNGLDGVVTVDSNDGNHRLRFNADTTYIEVTDQSNNLSKMRAADLYVGDGIGWLSNAVNAGGARTAVDGADIDIAGDADTVDGYDVEKDGTDGTGTINFKTQ